MGNSQGTSAIQASCGGDAIMAAVRKRAISWFTLKKRGLTVASTAIVSDEQRRDRARPAIRRAAIWPLDYLGGRTGQSTH